MTEKAQPSDVAAHREEPPPVLGTWRRLYAVVIIWLISLIAIFYLFTWRFAP
jgi:hypothetical protein